MNRKSILFFAVMAVIITTSLILYFMDKRVPMDPANVGNTSGNLQNGGLFCEEGDKVFFANASDNYCLYSMGVDESKPKRISTMGCKYINSADGFVYFYMDSSHKSSAVTGLGGVTTQHGIYRCKASGRSETCILRDFCGEVSLCGEYLYYQQNSNSTLNKIKCNKKDQSLVANEMISPVCYDNGTIYYTGVTNDHDLHTMSTASGDSTGTFLQGFYFFPAIQDGYIYYLDGDDNYSLWRANLYSGAQECISNDRIDCFNLDRLHVYYSVSASDNPALIRCNLDGSGKTVLFNGIANSINLTSKYLYFKIYGDDSMYYHMPLDGSRGAEPFIVTVK